MRSLQKPINDGGIKFPNLVTYCDLIYISNLFQYFKTREKSRPFKIETYLIEFEIGLTLSKMYDLPKLNHISHHDCPTPFYQKPIQILKEYKITLYEFTNEKIKQNYNRILLIFSSSLFFKLKSSLLSYQYLFNIQNF